MIKKKLLNFYLTYKKQIENFRILSIKYGQLNSILKGSSIDKKGNKLPWYTYPCIEYLLGVDFSNKKVFEYGSGNSSSFWALNAKSIISVENDENWFKTVSQNTYENQKIILSSDKKNYVESLNEFFDVIIIDGKFRKECVSQALKYISKDGLIILDNSDRKLERNLANEVRKNFDCIQCDFHGFGPINNYTWTTSLFFSRKFKIEPKNVNQPNKSIGALNDD